TFSVLSLLLIATSISVMSFLMPFYIQDVLHFSASFMGLIFLAAPVCTVGLATVSGRLTDRIGPRVPASIGVLATMGAFAIGLFLRVAFLSGLPRHTLPSGPCDCHPRSSACGRRDRASDCGRDRATLSAAKRSTAKWRAT